MPNAAVALSVVPTPATQDVPDGLELSIGKAMAAAASTLCLAGHELKNGGLTMATRVAGAERIYRLHELRQAAPEIDFETTAREQGLRAMRSCLTPEFCEKYGAAAGDPLMLNIIREVLAAVEEVAAFQESYDHERYSAL
jgi:hypothetical protein